MAVPASHQSAMEGPAATGDEPTAVYEVRLQGTGAASLSRWFPRQAVVTTRTETVLYREVETPAELDALVAQLLSLGLVPTEVKQRLEPGAPVAAPGREPWSR